MKEKFIVHVTYMSRGRVHRYSKSFKTFKEALAFEESIERSKHVSVGLQIK